MNNRRANDRHLLGRWVPIVIGILVSIATFAVVVSRTDAGGDDAAAALPLVFGLAIAGGTFMWTLQGAKRRLSRGLQEQSPASLIDGYMRNARRDPSLRAQFEISAATAAALYEQPELAEEHLSKVDWRSEPPLTKAGADIARSLICYARGEWTEGLRLSRVAAALADTDPRFPGAKTADIAFASRVALGQVFVGATNARTKEALLAGRERLPLIGQLIASWGLVGLSAEDATIDRAEHEAFIARHAPHCGLLRRLPV